MKEVARELGVSEATIYTWKSKYGGMEVSEARRLKELEDENRRLKHMVADSEPRQRGVENGDPEKRLELVGLRQDVALVMREHPYSERRACKLLSMIGPPTDISRGRITTLNWSRWRDRSRATATAVCARCWNATDRKPAAQRVSDLQRRAPGCAAVETEAAGEACCRRQRC